MAPWSGVQSGFERFISWFRETTFGVVDEAATFETFGVEADFETEVQQSRFTLDGLHSRDPRVIRVGNRLAGLRVTSTMHDTTLLKAVLGTADDLWTGAISARDHLPSFSFETIERSQGAVVGTGELYCGGKVNDYTLKAAAGQWLQQTFDVYAQDASDPGANNTMSIPNPPSARAYTIKGAAKSITKDFNVAPVGEPFMAFDSGVKYAYNASPGQADGSLVFVDPDAEAPVRTVTDWTLSVRNNLNRRFGVRNDGARFVTEIVEGRRSVTLEFVNDYRDLEHYRRFVRDADWLYVKLRIPTSGGATFITLRNGKFDDSKKPQTTNDLIALRNSITFKRDEASGQLPIAVGAS